MDAPPGSKRFRQDLVTYDNTLLSGKAILFSMTYDGMFDRLKPFLFERLTNCLVFYSDEYIFII